MMSEEDEADSRPAAVLPFLKWAGGKRWLTSKYASLLPGAFDRYVEPFLGSAAVYFYLQPEAALLSDSNPQLIDTYGAIRRDWRKVQSALRRHQKDHSSAYYYEERERVHRAKHEQAAQFIYLNRTCWNGLYRVNMRGQFNVPIGTKTTVCLDTDDFEGTAELLKAAEILTSDFERTLDRTVRGDFVFVDPPYVTRHNFNGFVKYNEKMFSWEDQERLVGAIRTASKRGVKFLITNADHASVRNLYRGLGIRRTVYRHSVLAADILNRGVTSELAVLVNYKPEPS
jgi:DNA adenine methylase